MTPLKKTAIVIGATGLIGSNVVELLVEAEHVDRIVVITRRPINFASEKIESHVIDFNELSRSSHLFVGDILFSCLGTTRKQAGSIAAQRIVDLEYQYTAARLACAQGLSHYLLVSSSNASEDSLSAYLKMKGELEAKVQALDFKYTTIIQPSLLLGERDDFRLAESLGSKVFPLLCRLPGLRRYRPISGKQVAEKMIELSETPSAKLDILSLDQVFPS